MRRRKVGAGSMATTSCRSSFKVSHSPMGSKSRSIRHPLGPKPPPPEPCGRHQNSAIAPRHATQWFVERLDMDCDRLLRARLWKLYDEGHSFGRLRGGRGGAVEYIMKQLGHPDE